MLDLLFVCPGCNEGHASLVCEVIVPLSLTILPVTGGDGVGFLYCYQKNETTYTHKDPEKLSLLSRNIIKKLHTVAPKMHAHVTIAQVCAHIPDVSPDASLLS